MGDPCLSRAASPVRLTISAHDVAHNRVIKAAMTAVSALPGLDENIAAGLRGHCRRLHDVSDVPLSPAAFRQVQLHRNLARYAFSVDVARLVERSLSWMRERACAGSIPSRLTSRRWDCLLRHSCGTSSARTGHFPRVGAKGALGPGPSRQLRSPPAPGNANGRDANQRVAPCGHRGEVLRDPLPVPIREQETHLGHLYQLLTYLSQLGTSGGEEPFGVLFYAGLGTGQPLQYRLGGYTVLVRSLDLNRDWRDVHGELMGMVRELSGASKTLVGSLL